MANLEVLRYPRAGVSNVGSYLVGGIPFLTGSGTIAGTDEMKISFPFITKKITVVNRAAADLRIHFATAKHGQSDSVNGQVIAHHQYITLDSKEDAAEFNVRVKEIFISPVATSGEWEVFAELTTIPTEEMYALSGSGITNDPSR
jgi:hypothetical protein